MLLILFAVIVEMDRVFVSRWCNEKLNKIRFAESYHEVTCFKQGLVLFKDAVDIITSNVTDRGLIMKTLDRRGTFPGMGISICLYMDIKVVELVKMECPIIFYDFLAQHGLNFNIL